MNVLLLRLAGPMQAWGDSSRFSRRLTRREPTRSGVLGMLAAAQGRRRTDPVEDLLTLRFGVRTDQPGRVLRDFQTARSLDGAATMPLSERYYITDGVFLAGVEGDDELIEGLADAVRSPRYPLYLGRRSCVPSRPVFAGVEQEDLEASLRDAKWQASDWFQRRQSRRSADVTYRCALSLDGPSSAPGRADSVERVRDVPRSWDPRRREYEWREVTHTTVEVPMSRVEDTRDTRSTRHDPWEEL